MGTRDDTDIGQGNGTSGGARKEANQPGKSPALQGFSVDEIMWQVRAELNRLRRGMPLAPALPAIFVTSTCRCQAGSLRFRSW